MAVCGAAFSIETASADQSCSTVQPIAADQAESMTADGNCDLEGAIVVDGGLAVVVPGEGEGVKMSATLPDGSSDFVVAVDTTGRVEADLSTESDFARAEESGPGEDYNGTTPRPGTSPGACDDGYYNAPSSDNDGGFEYYISTAVSGRAPGVDDEAGILRKAANSLADADDCGYADQVSLYSFNEGDTSRKANIGNSDGRFFCGQDDKYSVIDFGNIDKNGKPPVALACTWFDVRSGRDRITDYDMRFNIANYRFTSTPAANSCDNQFDLEGTALHEFGHAVGLEHVGEAEHGNLTMSTDLERCSTSMRTLGKGDIAALRSVY